MKFRITPLLFVSIGFFFYGIYCIAIDPNGWGFLIGLVALGVSVGAFLFYLIFRFIVFKQKPPWQWGIELFIIGIVIFFFYKRDGKFIFDLPPDFGGHVMVVYDVKGAGKLRTSFFSNKIKLKVPRSGVILTSSPIPNDKYFNGYIFKINGRPIDYSDTIHGLALSTETIICNGRFYSYDQWFINDAHSWGMGDDSLYNLPEKKKLACEVISGKQQPEVLEARTITAKDSSLVLQKAIIEVINYGKLEAFSSFRETYRDSILFTSRPELMSLLPRQVGGIMFKIMDAHNVCQPLTDRIPEKSNFLFLDQFTREGSTYIVVLQSIACKPGGHNGALELKFERRGYFFRLRGMKPVQMENAN